MPLPFTAPAGQPWNLTTSSPGEASPASGDPLLDPIVPQFLLEPPDDNPASAPCSDTRVDSLNVAGSRSDMLSNDTLPALSGHGSHAALPNPSEAAVPSGFSRSSSTELSRLLEDSATPGLIPDLQLESGHRRDVERLPAIAHDEEDPFLLLRDTQSARTVQRSVGSQDSLGGSHSHDIGHMMRELTRKNFKLAKKRKKAAGLREEVAFQRKAYHNAWHHVHRSIHELGNTLSGINESVIRIEEISAIRAIKDNIFKNVGFLEERSQGLLNVESRLGNAEFRLKQHEHVVLHLARRVDRLLHASGITSDRLSDERLSQSSLGVDLLLDLPQHPPSPDLVASNLDFSRSFGTPGESAREQNPSTIQAKIDEWFEKCSPLASTQQEANPATAELVEQYPDVPEEHLEYEFVNDDTDLVGYAPHNTLFGDLMSRLSNLYGRLWSARRNERISEVFLSPR